MRPALAALILLGCARPQEQPPAAVSLPPVVVAGAAPHGGRLPPSGDRCSLHVDHLYPPYAVSLVTPSGRPFGSFLQADDVTLGVASRGAELEVVVHGVRVRTRPGSLPLYSRERLTLGAFRTEFDTPLRWTGDDGPSMLVVSPSPDPHVEWLVQPPTRAVECAMLSLEPADYDRDPADAEDHLIDARTPVALAEQPGGDPFVRVVTGSDVAATVVQSQGAYAQVRVSVDNELYDAGTVTGGCSRRSFARATSFTLAPARGWRGSPARRTGEAAETSIPCSSTPAEEPSGWARFCKAHAWRSWARQGRTHECTSSAPRSARCLRRSRSRRASRR